MTLSCWVTTPTDRAIARRLHAWTGLPASRTCPAASGTEPSSARRSVDFPEPFGPSTAYSEPEGIWIETSRSASGRLRL